MPFNNIVEVEEALPNGYTSPFKVKCDDGISYVIKYICEASDEVENDEINGKVLFNELISARIAKKLKLKIPEFNVVNLPQSVIDNDTELQKYNPKAGLCFASKFIPNSFAGISKSFINICNNKKMLPEIMLFDQLIMNRDRGCRTSNILFNSKDNCFYIIDNTESFALGGIWDEESIRQRINCNPPVMVNSSDLKGTCYKFLGYDVKNINDFDDIINEINNLDVGSLFKNVPNSWGVSANEKSIIMKFIQDRINNIDQILLELKKENLFPQWKEA
ncbi:hypothetical protein M2S00_07265 [Apilactobacillus sp. TMW 2.2459]|uniref:HipA family kinase n=1 Tax=Apilactobacillus xinyiensis TaxID=2841032 RepID=UPI00200D9310|nr:HipA family kinase [Apilactobacillus xinyiensis]MCL0312905.1 hypothetical protein [Apilactobacillus xinyiensis]